MSQASHANGPVDPASKGPTGLSIVHSGAGDGKEPAADKPPDPSAATDLATFISLLGELRAWAGDPSYRTLAKMVGPLMRPPQEVSPFTVVDAFKPTRRRLNLDLVVAITRALGLGQADADRWRGAYLRVLRNAGSGGSAGVLRQLPADLATFTGRQEALDQVVRCALSASAAAPTNSATVFVIEGMAGVGKTQLATRAAYRLIEAGQHGEIQLYANLRGFDTGGAPTDPAVVLEAFLRQLGVQSQHIPQSRDERAAMYRDLLLGKDLLVLLDNAADAAQIRDLVPSSPSCLVLVTSRRNLTDLEGAQSLHLDVFTVDEALDLLRNLLGQDRVDAEPDAARRLVLGCGLLPLAVSIIGSRLRARPQWNLADMTARLEKGLAEITSRERKVPPVFDLSYRGIPVSARRVFRLLAAHPGPDFTVVSAASLVGLGADDTEQLLELLLDENLIQQRRPDRFELHDLLRAYAGQRLSDEDSSGERHAAAERIVAWYLATADAAATAINPTRHALPLSDVGDGLRFAGSAQALTWCDQEYPNLLAAAASQPGSARTWQLAGALATYLRLRWRWAEYDRLHLAGLEAAALLEDTAAEAWMRNNLGYGLAERGQPTEAAEHLERALALSRALNDPAGQSAALSNLAIVHAVGGNPELGLHYSLAALKVAREAGDRNREGSVLNKVAGCLCELGRFEEAAQYLSTKRDMHREDGDLNALGLALHNLAGAYEALEQYDRALDVFREYLDAAREAADLHGEAGARFGIARCLRANAAETAEAVEILTPACAIFDDLAVPEAAEAKALLAELKGAGSGS